MVNEVHDKGRECGVEQVTARNPRKGLSSVLGQYQCDGDARATGAE